MNVKGLRDRVIHSIDDDEADQNTGISSYHSLEYTNRESMCDIRHCARESGDAA